MTSERLEARLSDIAMRVLQAPKAPWTVDEDNIDGLLCIRDADREVFAQVNGTRWEDRDTAQFIAYSREDVELLLETLAREREQALALLEALRQTDAWIREWGFRDEKHKFFAQPNEINYCRAFIAEALASYEALQVAHEEARGG